MLIHKQAFGVTFIALLFPDHFLEQYIIFDMFWHIAITIQKLTHPTWCHLYVQIIIHVHSKLYSARKMYP